MATIFSNLFFIFALLTLFSSLVQARESQFFSKVSSTPTNTAATTTTNNVANVPNGKRQVEQNLFKEEQEATFIPDSQDQGGYGLYGHETTENVQATTTYNNYVANIPTKKQEIFSKQGYGLYGDETTENFQTSTKPTTTTATYKPYTTEAQENFNKKDTYYNKNGYEQQNYVDTRQGMSDTRFMENGKYYYDVQNKQNYYNPDQFDQDSRNYDEQYNGEGYYGNTGYQNQAEEFENEP